MSQKELVRYFEHMKPRNSIPTFQSQKTADAISMAYWHQHKFNQGQRNQSQDNRAHKQGHQNRNTQYNDSFNLNKQQKYQSQISNKQAGTKNKISQQQMRSPYQQNKSMIRNNSRLSNFGTTSLKKLPQLNSEREVYEKQRSKYNIITIEPNHYLQTIKKYPKYHLQNLDDNYEKKKQLQNQYTDYWKLSTVLTNSKIDSKDFLSTNNKLNPESKTSLNITQKNQNQGI